MTPQSLFWKGRFIEFISALDSIINMLESLEKMNDLTGLTKIRISQSVFGQNHPDFDTKYMKILAFNLAGSPQVLKCFFFLISRH